METGFSFAQRGNLSDQGSGGKSGVGKGEAACGDRKTSGGERVAKKNFTQGRAMRELMSYIKEDDKISVRQKMVPNFMPAYVHSSNTITPENRTKALAGLLRNHFTERLHEL